MHAVETVVLQTEQTHLLSCLISEQELFLFVLLKGHICFADSEQVKWVNLSEPSVTLSCVWRRLPEHVCISCTSRRAGRSSKQN